MGCKNSRTTMRYQQLSPDHRLQAVRLLDEKPYKPTRVRLICNDIINHTLTSKKLEDLDRRVGTIDELIRDKLMR